MLPRGAVHGSDADDAIELASAYGLIPDDWQEDALDDWMTRGRNGQWLAKTCGIAVPRQNGKNGIVEVRELFGMVELGEKFLHTAHEVKTARKAFKRLKHFFGEMRNDPNAKYPELNALVVEIRSTNGQEAIVLENGGSIEFVARSKGSGRGFTVDVLVLDEAQDLADEELEALLPTISSGPLCNPQIIVAGTPPNPEKGQTGEVFTRVRTDADKGLDPSLAFTDYGEPDGPLTAIDLDDVEKLRERNPAMASGRLQLEVCRTERRRMSAAGYARERFGWWGDLDGSGGTARPFKPGTWADLISKRAKAPKPAGLGIAAGLDQVWLSLGSASSTKVPWLGQILRCRADQERDEFIEQVAAIQRQRSCPVAIDPKGPAAFLIDDLESAGVTLQLVDADQRIQSCADLRTAVAKARVEHGNFEALNDAVETATWQNRGERKVFARGDPSLEAVALALWAAELANYDIDDSFL